MIVDHLDRHLPAAGGIEKAAVPMGMYLAWCVNLHLVSGSLRERAEQALLRLRVRELRGSELLVAACGGALDSNDLNDAGRRFTKAYYPNYLDDLRSLTGGDPYAMTDDWPHYDQVAKMLTAKYYGQKPGRGRGRKGRRAWWRFWA